jgi:flagellar hook-associated protein 3 FlgL
MTSNTIGSIFPETTYGSLTQLVANTDTAYDLVTKLSDQASSGLISSSYAGLGEEAATSLSLRPELSELSTWQTNIDSATSTMDVQQTALSQISSIASSFYTQVNSLNSLDADEIPTIAADAQSALRQVANLLDTQDGGVYVFAGQDSGNAPVPDADNILNSGFYTQIATAVSGLAANGAAATTASTLSIAESNAAGTSPFSAALSQPSAALADYRQTVQVGEGTTVAVSIVASANASVTSTGTSTTGSYMRDIMRALATIGSLSGSQVTDSTDFNALVSDTASSLQDALTALNQDAGVLGDQQTQLSTTQTTLADVSTSLQSQVSDAEDVDMAQVSTELSNAQTRLQASYDLLSDMKGLSLAAYLT